MITITVTGQDGVNKELARVAEAPELAILKLAERVFKLAHQGADRHTKTGALARSLGHGPKKIPGGWEIGHDLQQAPHAPFVHWGTKAHDIRPKNKKVLRFQIGNRNVFAKFVHHPGYKGDPWLTKAADQAMREFPAMVAAHIKG